MPTELPVLMVERAYSAHAERQREYDQCLRENLNSLWFRATHIHKGRSTFGEMLRMASLFIPDSVVVIANADIVFDETIKLAMAIGPEEFWILTRWEDGKLHRVTSADAWIFRTPARPIEAPFGMGRPGCDNKLAWLAKEAGYEVSNPAQTIKAHHRHASGLRSYTDADTVPGPYLNVPVRALALLT